MLRLPEMANAHLFRVILPVEDIERGATFYETVLDDPGERVSPNRHYFDCGGTILALVQPAGTEGAFTRPNPDHIYIAVPNLERTLERCRLAGVEHFDAEGQAPGIAERPWGERSFYVHDLDGNPVCFVQMATEFRGGAFVP